MTKQRLKRSTKTKSRNSGHAKTAMLYLLLLLLGFIGGAGVVFYVLYPRIPASAPEERPEKSAPWDNRLRFLVIHCTATKEGQKVSAEDIRLWHTAPPPKGRGWKKVGYTDLIHLDGRVERLVANNDDEWISVDELTNGAKGYNLSSIHIAYVGGCDSKMRPKDTRTKAQKEALERYVRSFHARHPKVQIIGHSLLTDKACPSFAVMPWLRSIGIHQGTSPNAPPPHQ